jgi:CheY-like chemotaxis protein
VLASAPRSSVAETVPTNPARTSGAGLRVLLVDDNAINQMFGEAMLERLGFRVAIASDGAEAIQRWKTESFDLILMDCHMPVMDGFAAARAIRQGELARSQPTHLPIVALTACVGDDEHADCIDAGMDAILQKPFDADKLLAMVNGWTAAQAAVSEVLSSRRACNPPMTIASSRAVASSSVSETACEACSLQTCSSNAAAV